MYGYIYKTTNLITGKIYVGQHRNTEFNPNYYGSGVRFTNVFNKYGKDNFKVELLEKCYSEQELNDKECYWIKELDSMNRTVGYNLMSGGYRVRGMSLSESSKHQISESLKEYFKHNDNPRKGVHLSDETKQKLRQKNLGKKYSEEVRVKHRGRPAWNKGIAMTEAQKQHLRELNTGKVIVQKNSHTIFQISLSGEIINTYPSLRQASIQTGFSTICIRRVCEMQRPQSHGYIWRYDNSEI